MSTDRILLDIAHVSRRGTSLRVTLPKKVSQQLSVEPRDIVGFYLEGDRIILEKMK
ncbi:MAG: AbrB/MazE/SpoVT family DNA-binding domain-containing protein [Thermoplasmataceae archaeon]